MVLATVLAPMLETSLQQSLLISQGSPMTFITRPISAVFVGLAILSLGRGFWKQMKSQAPEIAEEDES
jgi:putative tricarboxylic transport membrane protein